MKQLNRTETAQIWHLHLFGTLKIQRPDGKQFTFDGKKAGELLAYLFLHPNHPCDKSKIAALLWKDSDSISARTRLRQELANLRSLLDSENDTDASTESTLFEITRQTIRLRPECYTTDTQQFQENRELAAKASDPHDKLQLLTNALTIFNADLLIEYDDWVLPFRNQFLSDREQASHDAATLKQQIETADLLARLKQETSAEDRESVQPPRTANTSGNQYRQQLVRAALTVLFLFAIGRYLWRPKAAATSSTQSSASPVKAVVPPLEYGKEKWVYTYTPQDGENPDSEAKAVVLDTDNTLYATGLMQTENEDADILTVKLSPDGRQIWAKRYSSPEHDCDRAFAVTISGNKVYVAGETYVPASVGVVEGWRLVLICYDKEGKRLWVKRLPMTTKNHGHQIKVIPAGDGDAVIAGTGIVNGHEKVAVFYCNADSTLRWQLTVLPKNAQNSVLSGLGAVADYGIIVTGTALLGEGKNELDTNWLIAKISQKDGKIRWLRTIDGEGQGSDVARTMTGDRFNTLWIGGTLSASPSEQNGQYGLGVFKYDLDGMRLKRLETPFPKTTPWSYGGMCTSWYEGTTTVAVNRTIESKRTVPMLVQYDWQGVLSYQCDLPTSAEFPHLAIDSLCNADREGSIVLSGRLSATAETNAGVSQFWTARLNTDGSIRRQFCYPNRSQGNILLNGMVIGYVFGQVPLSNTNRAFVVFCYPY